MCTQKVISLIKQDMSVWIGWSWLVTWSSNELLWTWKWYFGFHKRQRLLWPADRLKVSQEGLFSKELVDQHVTQQGGRVIVTVCWAKKTARHNRGICSEFLEYHIKPQEDGFIEFLCPTSMRDLQDLYQILQFFRCPFIRFDLGCASSHHQTFADWPLSARISNLFIKSKDPPYGN